MNMKKLFLLNLPYLLFVYPFDKLAQAFRLAPGADLSGKLLSIGDGFTAALSSPWLSFHPTDLLIGIAGAVILRMAVYLKGKNAKKYRHGIEYGSARWGTAADIAPYMDKDFFQNIPMTQTERITMASRPKQPKYARNKNILVIGGSGSGKTRFFCKPSLLQAHSSYVCTDPKGTLLPEIGAFLERKKYRIKCLNLINFRKSMKYNPLAYIRSEKDIVCTCTEKCQAGAVNTACPVCVKNLSECVGTEQKASEPTEPENPEPEKKSNTGAILAVLLILAAGGGAAVYFLVLKPKQGKKVPADLDDFDLEDEEEYLTEDEETEEKNE